MQVLIISSVRGYLGVFTMKNITVKKIIAGIGFSCMTALSGLAQAATLDLLVLYDTHTSNYYGGDVKTAMNSWVDQINAAYSASQVDIKLRLVGVERNEEPGSGMGDVLGKLRVNASVIALRDRLGADFVSQLHQTGACGIGYVSVNKNYTWNVLAPGCGPMVMAHELGHNMGLNHSRRQGDESGSRYRYGVGYGVDNLFVDIMAYGSAFNARRVNRFSNPNILCQGVPCGIPEGQPQEAYGAKAIHNVRDEMAAFRPTAGTGGPTTPTGSVKVFQHCNFGGYSATLATGTYDLAKLISLGVRNDDISSIQVPAGYKVTLYFHDKLVGTALSRTQNDSCFVSANFNDVVSSIKVEVAN
jgi:hypothetical protein